MAQYRGDATFWNQTYDFAQQNAGRNGPMWHGGGMNRSPMGSRSRGERRSPQYGFTVTALFVPT